MGLRNAMTNTLTQSAHDADIVQYTARVEPEGKRAKHVPLTDEQIVAQARRILRKRSNRLRDTSFTEPKIVADYLSDHFFGLQHEEFVIMLLDNQHKLIHLETLFRGTLNAAPVYPREVVKLCFQYNAGAVMFAHCHPSGNLEPSQADRRITERLKGVLGGLDITLLDHFICNTFGDGDYISFANRGIL